MVTKNSKVESIDTKQEKIVSRETKKQKNFFFPKQNKTVRASSLQEAEKQIIENYNTK